MRQRLDYPPPAEGRNKNWKLGVTDPIKMMRRKIITLKMMLLEGRFRMTPRIPLSKTSHKKSHQKYGFEEPFINYSPSIGISEILFLPAEFNFMNGNNLIVSSLRAASIYFIEISKDFKNILKEDRIFFSSQRIRDITYDQDSNVIFIIFEVTPSIGILRLN